MQAFKAKATVSEDSEVHLTQIPFPPGSELEIILLGQGAHEARSGESGSLKAGTRPHRDERAGDDAPEAQRLVRDQYRLAMQYPGEYVVLVGTRTVHHSADRQEALEANRQSWVDSPSERPVVVAPSGEPKQKPYIRGRPCSDAMPASARATQIRRQG